MNSDQLITIFLGSNSYVAPFSVIKKCGKLSESLVDGQITIGRSERDIIAFQYLLKHLGHTFENSNYKRTDYYWIFDHIIDLLGVNVLDLIEYYLIENGIPELYRFSDGQIVKVSIKEILTGKFKYLTTKSHYKTLVGKCLITQPATIEQIEMYRDTNWLDSTAFTKQSTMALLDYNIDHWVDACLKMCNPN